jgi:hypothetical protein
MDFATDLLLLLTHRLIYWMRCPLNNFMTSKEDSNQINKLMSPYGYCLNKKCGDVSQQFCVSEFWRQQWS